MSGPSGAAGSAPDERPASAAWTGQTGAPTRLLLLRHGQTPLSVQRRYSGRGNPGLTELGLAQAAAAAARLAGLGERVSAVLASPLRRTLQTAEVVAAATGARLEVRSGLVETDFGDWDGLSFAEASERDPDLHRRWLGSEEVAPPNGESFAEVAVRVAAERAAIVAAHHGSTIVLVSHVTPIKLLLREALRAGPSVLYRLHLDLAGLSVIDCYPDGNASVRLVNDTSHLPR